MNDSDKLDRWKIATDEDLREIKKDAECQYRIFGGTRRRVDKSLAKDFAVIMALVDEVRKLRAREKALKAWLREEQDKIGPVSRDYGLIIISAVLKRIAELREEE